MITPEEKTLIISVLGKSYSKTIVDYLATNDITTRKNKPIDAQYVRNLVNQIYDDENVDIEILNHVHEQKLLQIENLKIRNLRNKEIKSLVKDPKPSPPN